ncbi:MAG: glycosyltransferase [Promethearchaeota archaeon]
MKNKFKKEFLFIVNSFPPVNNQNSIRALEISKRIIKDDFLPIILTRRLEIREPKDYSLVKELPPNLEVHKTAIIELKKKFSLRTLFFKIIGKFFNLYTYTHWVPFGYIRGCKLLQIHNEIKFIYSTGPPYYSHLIGYLLKKNYNLPLLIEYRDPWTFNPHGLNFKKNLNHFIQLKIERKILKSSDMIITVSEPLKIFLLKHFPEISNKPIYIIPNGLNLINYNGFGGNDEKRIIITFIGKLYGSRNIEPILRIISNLKKENKLNKNKFIFKIFGIYDESALNTTLKLYNITDLVYLGKFLKRSQIYEEIKKSYLTVHIGENLNYPTIGFKVWDYLSCRKKIIYLGRENSFTARFLIENDFGITIPINNTNKGQKIFEKLISDIFSNKFSNTIDKEKIIKFSWDRRVEDLKLYLKNF